MSKYVVDTSMEKHHTADANRPAAVTDQNMNEERRTEWGWDAERNEERSVIKMLHI